MVDCLVEEDVSHLQRGGRLTVSCVSGARLRHPCGFKTLVRDMPGHAATNTTLLLTQLELYAYHACSVRCSNMSVLVFGAHDEAHLQSLLFRR